MKINRAFPISAAVVCLCFYMCGQDVDVSKMSESDLVSFARSVHNRVLTLDTHIDIEVTSFTPEKPGEAGYEKLARLSLMDEGGLNGAFFAIYTPQGPLTENGYKEAYELVLSKFEQLRNTVKNQYFDKAAFAFHPDDVRRIYEQGKKVVIIGIENGYPIGEDLSKIREFYELGGRYITLSHIGHNQICDSNLSTGGPAPEHDGLSRFGREVVAEMNRLGFIIDVSHISKKSMLDVVEISKAPVMASHSSISYLCDMERMWDDEQLDALKENGGVIHLVGLKMAIKADPPEKTDAVNRLRREFDLPVEYWPFFNAFKNAPAEVRSEYERRFLDIEQQYPSTNVKDFVDHIDYVVNRIGIDHAGISSDFYDSSFSLDGWKDASETFNVTLELVRRGYTEEEIEKIWSGNILRVWKEVEEAAGLRK